MSRTLPASPSAEYLRKEAKSLLKAHRRGDPACCDVFRHLYHLRDQSDEEILRADISLTTTQFALAMDYGFRTWAELMAQVETGLGGDLDDPANDGRDGERYARTEAVRDGANVWLKPIPRYPYVVRRVDKEGNTLRHEQDLALHSKIVGNLYCAMNMRGAAVSWPEVAVASGEAFRFAFEPRWAQDAEYISDVDAFVQACETLGFAYTRSTDQSREASLALIDGALAAGRPALITGWGDRFWRVVVGVEPEAGVYRHVGGVDFDDGIPMADLSPGEDLPMQMAPADCPACPIPAGDWYGPTIGPEQVARNPVFIVGEQQPVPEAARIRRILQNALAMNRPRSIKRINLEHRKQALAAGPEGHGGWIAYFSPWESEFTMGSQGLRAWADHVEGMETPDDDFEMVHGIDVTFGGYMACRAQDAMAWLAWAERRVPNEAVAHLRRAREAFAQIGRVSREDLGLVRTVACYLTEPPNDNSRSDLSAMLDTQPALIYLVTDEEKAILGERAADAKGSPWGWRLLPSQSLFEQAQGIVAGRLRHLAHVRDEAFDALGQALASL